MRFRTASWTVGCALLLICGTSARARLQKEDQAAAHIESRTITVKINRDYSVEVTEEYVAAVDQAAAIEDLSVFQLFYSPPATQARMLSASTINNGKSIAIDPKLSVDRAVMGTDRGYDSLHEIRTSFSQVGVGSRVAFKYWRKTSPTALPRFFSELFSAGDRYPVRSFTFRLDSPVPIQYEIVDPGHLLNVRETNRKTGTHIEAVSARPIFHYVLDEPLAVFTAPTTPTIFVSSGKSWEEFATPFAREYEKTLQEPLPPEMGKIAAEAAGKADPVAKVELTLNRLHNLVHYLGNWQTVRGRYFPRHLKEIEETRFGDCKDYSIAAATILRKVGVDVSPAWTRIDESLLASKEPGSTGRVINFVPPLPGFFFNHAILKIQAAPKVYWVDATAPFPYVRGISPVLGGAPALVLKVEHPAIELIPLPSPSESGARVSKFIHINTDRSQDQLVRIEASGFMAGLIKQQTSQSHQSSSNIEDYLADTERKATNDQTYDQYSSDNLKTGLSSGESTTAGVGVRFDDLTSLAPLLADQSQTVGSLNISSLGTSETISIIEGGKLLGQLPGHCEIDSQWFAAQRKFARISDTAYAVSERFEAKVGLIPNSELQGTSFGTATESIKKCWKGATLVFEPKSEIKPELDFHYMRPWTMGAAKMGLIKLRKLFKRGLVSISGEFRAPSIAVKPSIAAPEKIQAWAQTASPAEIKAKAMTLIETSSGSQMKQYLAKLLMLALAERTPDDPEVFGTLARAELYLGYIKNSEYEPEALKRAGQYAYYALEMDPLNALANRELARVLLYEPQGVQDALAESEFALSLDPGSDSGRAIKGRILMELGRLDEALSAASGTTDYFLLEKLYTRMKRYDDARATYEAEIKAKPSAWAYLNYAGFLSSQGKHDQAIETAKKSLELAETGMGHTILADAYSNKAVELVRSPERMQEGLTFAQKALEEDNSNGTAHSVIGYVLVTSAKSPKDAQTLYQAADHYRAALQALGDPSMLENLLRIDHELKSWGLAGLDKSFLKGIQLRMPAGK